MTNQTVFAFDCFCGFWGESANLICPACGEPCPAMFAEVVKLAPTQTNTNSNPLGVANTGVTKPLSARIAQAIAPSVDSQ
jgi:hypothetical protein